MSRNYTWNAELRDPLSVARSARIIGVQPRQRVINGEPAAAGEELCHLWGEERCVGQYFSRWPGGDDRPLIEHHF